MTNNDRDAFFKYSSEKLFEAIMDSKEHFERMNKNIEVSSSVAMGAILSSFVELLVILPSAEPKERILETYIQFIIEEFDRKMDRPSNSRKVLNIKDFIKK